MEQLGRSDPPRNSTPELELFSEAVLEQLRKQAGPGCVLCTLEEWDEEEN